MFPANDGGARSSLGSRPGAWSSLIISSKVSSQISYLVDACWILKDDIVSDSFTAFFLIPHSPSIIA
jgi:hypothetical protein